MSDNSEIAKILKESLKIVNELGKLDVDNITDDDMDDLYMLIKKAKELKRNKNWKL